MNGLSINPQIKVPTAQGIQSDQDEEYSTQKFLGLIYYDF